MRVALSAGLQACKRLSVQHADQRCRWSVEVNLLSIADINFLHPTFPSLLCCWITSNAVTDCVALTSIVVVNFCRLYYIICPLRKSDCSSLDFVVWQSYLRPTISI